MSIPFWGRRPPGCWWSSPDEGAPTEELHRRIGVATPRRRTLRSLSGALHPEHDGGSRRTVQERCGGIPLFIEEVVAKLRHTAPTISTIRPRCRTPSTRRWSPGCARAPTHCWSSKPPRSSAAGSTGTCLSAVTGVGPTEDRLPARRSHPGPGAAAGGQTPVELPPRTSPRGGSGTVAAQRPPAAASSHRGRTGRPKRQAVTGMALVAHHFENADRFDEAATAYQRASSEARERGALIEARNHLAGRWRTSTCSRRATAAPTARSPSAWSAGSLRPPLPATPVPRRPRSSTVSPTGRAKSQASRCSGPSARCGATTLRAATRSGDEALRGTASVWRTHPIGARRSTTR